MAKPRKKALAAINTEGWMMSYADMATILLAMFIVLSTLGKDQTGASLQKGLESWRETRHSFGLAGIFTTSDRPGGFGTAGPHYNLDRDGNGGSGQDDSSGKEGDRSTDQENERFQHFLGEMERQFKVDRLPHTVGQATVDLYDPFNKVAPFGQRNNKSYWFK